jgi:hypothetical protein
MENRKYMKFLLKLFRAGGWFPLSVFVGYYFLKYVVYIKNYFRHYDLPIHILGGISFAYFISEMYQLLPREGDNPSRGILRELLLMGSLTATAALLWEVFEFSVDFVLHTTVQESLFNTMLDLVMGLIGAAIMVGVRAWQLRFGLKDVKAVLSEMSG